jgi:tetratricopeptide (TPR) repeat protein
LPRLLPLLVLLGSLQGCAPPLEWRRAAPMAVELGETPFFPQEDYHCGPAALATLLAPRVPGLTAEALVQEVYVPARQGSLQPELIATARRHGQVPVRLPPTLSALSRALEAGFPLLVLQNLGLRAWPVWHYAVVIGIDPVAEEVLLRSGTEARLRLPARRFLASWERAGSWAFSVHAPSEPPAWAEADDWLDSVAVWARTGDRAWALQAAEAAVYRWPDHAAAGWVLGNARYASGDPEGAVLAFGRALERQPLAGGYQNLAHVLAEQGCTQAAAAVLAEGLERFPDHPGLTAAVAELPPVSSADAAGCARD